jgi:hypothetical protein
MGKTNEAEKVEIVGQGEDTWRWSISSGGGV